MTELDELSRDAGEVYGSPAPRAAALARWREALARPEGDFLRHLQACYGTDEALLGRRRKLWQTALDRFAQTFGTDGEVFLIGVPSRINWEGHHVDHQGGSYNSTTDEREILLVVRARGDRRVRVENVDAERFVGNSFELGGDATTGGSKGEWHTYVKGALLALGRRAEGRQLQGMDIVVGSDIPVGAGLSSSHALVLGSALAATATSGVPLDKRDAVILVQDGEWFVGSRTGLGDQASMVFGRRGRIFSSPVIDKAEIKPRYVPLPPGYACILIDSYVKHKLSGVEGLAYNARVFAYKAAFPLVLDALRALGADGAAVAATRRLAEIGPDRFAVADIYRALATLPDEMSLADAEARFDRAVEHLAAVGAPTPALGFRELLGTYFRDVFPEVLAVKGVALYGLAECWRSRLYADLLEKGDLARAGRLVDVGHDGDRVARREGDGYVLHEHPVTNELLQRLAADSSSGNPARVEAARLEWQPGDYRASVRELDHIVDVCRELGSAGASLTGGGLGGVVTAMVPVERMPVLRQRVMEMYEREERDEVAGLEAAERAGKIDGGPVAAARRIQSARQATRSSEAPFRPDPGLLAALAPAEGLTTPEGDPLVRLLRVDYHHDGLLLNGSIAGAGYLRPPA